MRFKSEINKTEVVEFKALDPFCPHCTKNVSFCFQVLEGAAAGESGLTGYQSNLSFNADDGHDIFYTFG